MTEEELLEVIGAALSKPPAQGEGATCEPGSITTGIVAQKFDVSRTTASNILKRMHRDGLIEPAYVEYRDQWGMRFRCRGYRYTNGKAPAD